VTARVRIEVAALGGLRCMLERNEYGDWCAALFRQCKRETTFVAWGFASSASEVSAVEDQSYLRIGRCHFELPAASLKKLEAWLDQVTNATPEGDNRGVPAGGSHAGPDAAAGKPDAAVEGALQPTPHDDAPPRLQQAAGRQALPVQSETPAGAS
jgi:hypothetical protein